MSAEEDIDDEIILEIENESITCLKKDLTQHSDYFKAMFEGSFVESKQKIVRLEGIDSKPMKIILSLLWDRTFLINEEDILSVLQVSCMLQFIEIRIMCITKLTELLLPRNCLKIWMVAEQLDLKPLYLKAKSMSLMEFDVIKDLDCVTELQLRSLCLYLGNTNLECKHEMDVFQTLMKWWYNNSSRYLKAEHGDIFLSFLRCLDFKKLLNSDINEILTYPDIASDERIGKIVQCVLDLRHKLHSNSEQDIKNIAQLLNNSKSRSRKEYTCILVKTCPEQQRSKKIKDKVYRDKYLRKRPYECIDSPEMATEIIYYDHETNNFVKLLEIDKEKCENLVGFKIVGYKEFIFLIGGEYLIGTGHWNKNVWVYDIIRENWERKTILPFQRRHFECCVCGDYIYIISGTGKYRVIADNMFWYNFKEDKWSKEIQLPCLDRPVICCNWKNQLFLFCVNNKRGYIFDNQKAVWYTLNISVSKDTIFTASTVFSYKNRLYIKDNDHIIKLKLEDNTLVPVFRQEMQSSMNEPQSVVCDDIVYMLYKLPLSPTSMILETYCMKTQRRNVILKSLHHNMIQLQRQMHSYKMLNSISTLQHYNLIEKDDFVN